MVAGHLKGIAPAAIAKIAMIAAAALPFDGVTDIAQVLDNRAGQEDVCKGLCADIAGGDGNTGTGLDIAGCCYCAGIFVTGTMTACQRRAGRPGMTEFVLVNFSQVFKKFFKILRRDFKISMVKGTALACQNLEIGDNLLLSGPAPEIR